MRPEGWRNEYWAVVGEKDAFEAGADAYEEGIWKMAKESPTGTFTFDTHVINCPSVFTSEEL